MVVVWERGGRDEEGDVSEGSENGNEGKRMREGRREWEEEEGR